MTTEGPADSPAGSSGNITNVLSGPIEDDKYFAPESSMAADPRVDAFEESKTAPPQSRAQTTGRRGVRVVGINPCCP